MLIREEEEYFKLIMIEEMLNVISRQWKDPLSTIATSSFGLSLKKTNNMLNENDFFEHVNLITTTAKNIYHSLEEIENFYNQKKDSKTPFLLKDTFQKAYRLFYYSMKEYEIVNNIPNIYILSYEKELLQIFLFLIINTKDIIEKRRLDSCIFFIEAKTVDGFCIITIKDNLGGFEQNILDKVFKEVILPSSMSHDLIAGKTLLISKQILNNKLKGDMTITNTRYTYKNIRYKGAKFEIKIPLSIESINITV